MQNIIIAYASHYGSTAAVAHEIGKQLTREGLNITVKAVADIENLELYDAAIIGSPIEYDRWMPEARDFLKRNSNRLSEIPVAYFFCCLALAQRSNAADAKAEQYAKKLTELDKNVKPISIGRFGGVLNYSAMPFILRVLFRIFGKLAGFKAGDYRDWNKIQQWAKELENLMTKAKSAKEPY